MSTDSTNDKRPRPWNKDWGKRILVNAIALFILIIIMKCFNNQKQFNGAICHEKETMEASSFNFVVTGKFKDSNHHNYNTIKYLDLNKMVEDKLFVVNEIGGFYNSIHVGDTLFKKSGDLKVNNSNRDTTYLLIYNCIENYKKEKRK